jgi:uroporphyrinogen decarboxylase
MTGFASRLLEKRKVQETLDPRTRVETALRHREADRVPIDFWATREVRARLVEDLGMGTEDELLCLFGVDFRVIRGPSLVGLELERLPDGRSRDLWGVIRRPVSFGAGASSGEYQEVAFSPLRAAKTLEEIDSYEGWPSADWWDYSHVADDCGKHEGYCVVFAGDRLDRTAQLKPGMYLRGMKEIFRDLRANPEMAKCIFQHIVDYFLEYNRRVFEAADGRIDVFMMGDDFGTQAGPMMPVGLWREFFEEGFRKFVRLAHRYDIKVMHHTCGSVGALIPRFVEAGLDILQSLQPRAHGMDLGQLKAEFGRDLGFHGSMDIQHTLPRGTPQGVRGEVADRMSKGKPGGGFIICTAHNIQVDVPTPNVLALVAAYHHFGAYP